MILRYFAKLSAGQNITASGWTGNGQIGASDWKYNFRGKLFFTAAL